MLTPASLTYCTINDALRTVTGCMRPIPADNLPISAGIQSAELRRNGATLSLARRLWIFNICYTQPLTCSSSGNTQHLKSRHPLRNNSSVHLTTITEVRWNAESLECTTRFRTFIPEQPSWNGTAKNSMQYPRQNEAKKAIVSSEKNLPRF